MPDSIASQDSGPKQHDQKKNRKPTNSAFRQQRLKAWQPILTPKTVIPLFFIIGIIFAPIGGLLLYASSNVREIRLDYTDCGDIENENEFQAMPADNVQMAFKVSTDGHVPPQWRRNSIELTFDNVTKNYTQCSLLFYIPEAIKAPVYYYYRLTNFYQNHRRYVNSFSKEQLKGDAISKSTIADSNCQPLATWTNTSLDASDANREKIVYPCGLIANSLFNDTFSPPIWITPSSGGVELEYTMTQSGIAWPSDRELYGSSNYTVADDIGASAIVPPRDWAERYPRGYHGNVIFDPSNDEPFMVWMRTAGLPDFSKLAMRNDSADLQSGTYRLDIVSHFPVTAYRGKKAVILSNTSVIGGRNPFLGIVYIVVGGMCIILGVVFAITAMIKPRILGDHRYLSWNTAPVARPGTSAGQAPPGTATSGVAGVGLATGRDLGR